MEACGWQTALITPSKISRPAVNAGNGFQQALRGIAEMFGLDVEKVTFEPDLDFASPVMTGPDASEWAKAQRLGFPVSSRTLHSLARRGGVTEKTFDEEIEEIEDDPLAMATIPPVGGPTPFKEGDDGKKKPDDDESDEPDIDKDGDGKDGKDGDARAA